MADQANLRLQRYAELCLHAALHLLHQAIDFARCGVSAVDDKARVHFAYLRVAHAIALEAGLLNQRAGLISNRTLEKRPAAGILQRLFFAAARGQIGHRGLDFIGAAGG